MRLETGIKYHPTLKNSVFHVFQPVFRRMKMDVKKLGQSQYSLGDYIQQVFSAKRQQVKGSQILLTNWVNDRIERILRCFL